MDHSLFTAKGSICAETMKIGSATVTQQIWLMISVAIGLENLSGDGVMGLGFNHATKIPSFIETLKLEGKIEEPVFAMYFSDNAYIPLAETSPESNIIIGGYDLATYSTDIEFSYVPVMKPATDWVISVSKFNIGNEHSFPSENSYALIDTSNQSRIGPYSQVKILFSQISSLLPTADYSMGVLQFKCVQALY
jgi:hypothetical protein